MLDQLSSAPRQQELVERMLELTGSSAETVTFPPKKELTKISWGPGALSSLIKKGVLEQFEKEETGAGAGA